MAIHSATPQLAAETYQLLAIERGQLLVPVSAVVGIFNAAQLSMAATGERWYGRHAGRTFPISFFHRLVGHADRRTLPAAAEWQAVQRQSVVLLQHGGQWAGVVVDEARERLEVIARPFDQLVKSAPGLRGTAVLSNGAIAYVVQPAEVIALAMVASRRDPSKG